MNFISHNKGAVSHKNFYCLSEEIQIVYMRVCACKKCTLKDVVGFCVCARVFKCVRLHVMRADCGSLPADNDSWCSCSGGFEIIGKA